LDPWPAPGCLCVAAKESFVPQDADRERLEWTARGAAPHHCESLPQMSPPSVPPHLCPDISKDNMASSIASARTPARKADPSGHQRPILPLGLKNQTREMAPGDLHRGSPGTVTDVGSNPIFPCPLHGTWRKLPTLSGPLRWKHHIRGG
jgi:hypothetical protein